MITQYKLKEIMKYDPNTGDMTRTKQVGSRGKIGAKVGCKTKNGYLLAMVEGRLYYVHRLIWVYMTGEMPLDELDHINHVRDDNRWINLRAVSKSENLRNSSVRKKSKSGVTGVTWDNGRSKWLVQINGKFLGYFNDFFLAICTRKSAELKYGFHLNHGDLPPMLRPQAI